MPKLIMPKEVLEKLVCMTCKNYLSLFPVYIKSEGSGAICGRCKVPDEDNFIRDVAYENFAKFIVFPCRYKSNSCKEQLMASEQGEHEKFCRYRKLQCPTKGATKCQWEGMHIELKTHFHDKHSALLLSDAQFELSFVSSYKDIVIVYYDAEMFIVKRQVDSCEEKFECSVQHLILDDTAECYDFQLRLTSGDKTYTRKLERWSTTEPNNISKFDSKFIEKYLESCASVIVNIDIMKVNARVEEDEIPKEVIIKNPNVNWDLLNELECPICFEFMLAPIYQCIKGHSICSECKNKINICAICKEGFQDTKNFVLEKLSLHLIYPCKFYKTGCTYSAKSTEIKPHEDSCEFGPYDCPLKEAENCQNKLNISEIVDHVDAIHAKYILNSDKINVTFDKDQDDERFYLIKTFEKVFKLHYKYADQKLLWSLQLVGPARECDKFKVEIDVLDNTKNQLRCYLRGMCVPLSEKAKSFTEPGKYIMLVLEQVQPLITQTLSYRVHVLKG